MDEGVALRVARGAVREAMRKHGGDRQRAIQELQEMAEKDPQLSEAFAVTGYLDLEAAQSVKH